MAESDKNEIFLSSSPHYSMPATTKHVMLCVVLALLPIAGYGVWLFGVSALVTIVVSVLSCVAFETAFRLMTGREARANDFSAVITGLLLALVLPPSAPVWMTVLGALFAVVVAKEFFGGLGANVFNPALSGRAFLFVSFATPLTTWLAPRAGGVVDAVDAVTTATPLAWMKAAEGAVATASEIADKTGFFTAGELYWNLFFGRRGGCIGESSIFLILLAFAFLALTRIIDWRAPLAMVATALLVTVLAGIDPLLTVLSGGLLFGATFMITDYATSPVTPVGRIVFGAGAGLITALIRVFGGFPEGVMFSILIMNALVPFLNRIIPRKYGWVKPARASDAGGKK